MCFRQTVAPAAEGWPTNLELGRGSVPGDPVPGDRSLGIVIGALLFGLVFVSHAGAWQQTPALQALLDGETVVEQGIELDLPAVTQDGSSVQVGVSFVAPLTGNNTVEGLYLFALGNPSPELIEFSLSPLMADAGIQTRIRLDGSQTVVALARTAEGRWHAAARDVRVTVSGCLSRDGTYRSSDLMQARARAGRAGGRGGRTTDVRTMINHPMETGLRRDATGAVIPENIVRSFEARHDGVPILSATLHRAMAANPYILFHYSPSSSGTLNLRWSADEDLEAELDLDVRID